MATRKEYESLSRSDLDTIIEVNKRAIEIQIEVAAQNEKIIEELDECKKLNEDIKRELENSQEKFSDLKTNIKENKKDLLDKISGVEKKIDEFDKSQFKLYVLLTSGAIAIILQLIQMFLNWKK